MIFRARWVTHLLVSVAILIGADQHEIRNVALAQSRGPDKNRSSTQGGQPDEHRIVPGSRVGPLRIGDSKKTALRLFAPKAGTDLTYSDECGGAYDWVQLDEGGISRGTVTIRFRHDVVTQIESGSPMYTTSGGTKLYDPPDKVRRHWPGLKAYALLPASPEAAGELPLIFWVAEKMGIAFEFAYSPEKRQRYLYRTIVFAPGAHLCPEGRGESLNAETWHPLPPFATQLDEHQ